VIGRLFGAALGALALVGLAAPVSAQEKGDPAFLALTASWFDFNLKDNQAFEGRAEWRGSEADRFWIFKPLFGAMATSDGAVYGFAGVLVDLYFGNRIVVTPSFAPGLYSHGGGKDLGHVIEFRSGIELAYRFDDRSRIGIGISHMSNAGIGDQNRGEESAYVTYSIPIGDIFR
jgi:hypothetical protein